MDLHVQFFDPNDYDYGYDPNDYDYGSYGLEWLVAS